MRAKGLIVGEFKMDSARDFINKTTESFTAQYDTKFRTSVAYQAWQNGVAERANSIIETMGRAMLQACLHLPPTFWPWACNYAANLSNLTITRLHQGRMTPLEAWNRAVGNPKPVPNIAHLEAFGHAGYVHIPQQKRTRSAKFNPNGIKAYLVGMDGSSIYFM
jgi:hypothetical protein